MGESSSSLFKYHPLRDREIRLLRVFPGKKSSADIRCEMLYRNLDSHLEYEALSYTWGDETLNTFILCDGKRLSVRLNLDMALRALRYVDRSRVLWVDAVCINQGDNDEKGQQVRMMRDIYVQAGTVVAWVGEKDEKDEAALDLEKYLSSNESRLSPDEVQTWIALPTFIGRQWFSRVWIVQELAVARKLTLHCGRRQMDWDILRRGLIEFLDRMGLYLDTSKADVSFERVFTLLSIRNLVTDHSEEQQESQGRFYKLMFSQIDDDRTPKKVEAGDLLHFVRGTRLFGATREVDHIFALLGLVDQEESNSIEINYNTSFSSVYREFVHVMIAQKGTLDVLSQAGLYSADEKREARLSLKSADKDHDRLPSWVPDWRIPPKSYPLRIQAYSASGTNIEDKARLKPMGHKAFQEGCLTLPGKFVDTIATLTPGFFVSNTPKSQVWERTALYSIRSAMAVVAVLKFKNPLSSIKAIPSFGETRTVRITPELQEKWFQAAKPCQDAYRSRQGLQDFNSVYIQTLIGNLPFKQLHPRHDSLVRTCFEIWQERLVKNPIMILGIIAKDFYKKNTVKVPRELNILFARHQSSWLSMEREANAKRGLVQANSSTRFPCFVNEKALHACRSVQSIFRKSSQERMVVESPSNNDSQLMEDAVGSPSNNESQLLVDDASVKLGVARMFSRAVDRMSRNRQFCTTRKGYMGWVPLETRLDDDVYLLEGGRVPYILRKDRDQGRHIFVGEAYIQGLMEGEEWGLGDRLEEISLI